jgi:hypothetical protein
MCSISGRLGVGTGSRYDFRLPCDVWLVRIRLLVQLIKINRAGAALCLEINERINRATERSENPTIRSGVSSYACQERDVSLSGADDGRGAIRRQRLRDLLGQRRGDGRVEGDDMQAQLPQDMLGEVARQGQEEGELPRVPTQVDSFF